jgi:hypothetical protein
LEMRSRDIKEVDETEAGITEKWLLFVFL